MGLGYGIRNKINPFRIPDPGVKKAPDPGSGSATLRITIADPDPAFHFNANPDPDPARYQSARNLRPAPGK